METDLRAMFEQVARGVPGLLVLVSIESEQILAVNGEARRAGIAPGASLWSVVDGDDAGRAFWRASLSAASEEARATVRCRDARFSARGWRLANGAAAAALHLARADADGASDGLAQLERAISALSAARTPAEVVHAVLSAGAESAGAHASALFRASDGELRVVDQVGFGAEVSARFAAMPLDSNLPAPEAVRTRQVVTVESAEDFARRYRPDVPVLGSLVALPLIVGGEVLGAVGLSFHGPRRFLDPELTRMQAFAAVCAHAFERALLVEAAAAAERRKDEFLAMLGHELRNPLAPIQTAVEIMRSRDPERFRREREVIERQARHLALIVDDIRDVTRITTGKLELRRAPGRLDETVQRAIDQIAPALERRHHELDVIMPEAPTIDVDHDRLAQVIANLLDNAGKYTDPGGHITLEIGRGDDGAVELRVRDNGRGIARELLPRVFDAFAQDARTGARTPGGLGLGLAIAKGIVDLHGGKILVASDGPGAGTEVLVRIPDSVIPPAAEPTDAPADDAAAPEEPRTRGLVVLVVDDNQDAAALIAEGLAALGYRTLVASDGPTALRVVGETVPDVALIDLGMPVMDGFELSRQLRALEPLAHMRHIAVTGYGADKDHEATRTAGFDAHLTKPVRLAQVAATIADLVRARDDAS